MNETTKAVGSAGAGRFSAASHFTPVSANLLHHAVEMFLKGCLVTKVGFDLLPRRKAGHDLNALWEKFREYFPDPKFERYTTAIAELHNFEQIRYPEKLITNGGLLGVGFLSGVKNVQLYGPKLPEYQLAVNDIDDLVKDLFDAGNVNPMFYSTILSQQYSSQFFQLRNTSPLI